jgi:hypothetical protein
MAIRLNKGFVLRKIGPQYMAVPFGEMTNRVKGMVTLTESGYLLWKALEEGADSVEAMATVLTDTYDVDGETALADAKEFLDYLVQLGAAEA